MLRCTLLLEFTRENKNVHVYVHVISVNKIQIFWVQHKCVTLPCLTVHIALHYIIQCLCCNVQGGLIFFHLWKLGICQVGTTVNLGSNFFNSSRDTFVGIYVKGIVKKYARSAH